MEVKPGYKLTEVGVIPEDWEVALLDSLAQRGSGHTPDRARAEYWGGQIKWISLQDSDRLDRLYIYDTAAKITPEGIANSSARMHPSGTVVLSRDAGVGKSAIMKGDMAVSQHFMAWRCGSLLNNHFLYYWLQDQKSEFERIAMGNTIKTIGLPYFRRFTVPLPTKAEQEAIAEALSDADDLIESLEQLIAKKRHLKQGAMQELLTGKKRLPGFAISEHYKLTEVGVIPEDWEVTTVGREFSVQLGKMLDLERNSGSPKPYLGNRAVQWGGIDMDDIGVVKLSPSDVQRYRLRLGDLLVCEGGESGRAAIWDEPIEECYYQKALHRLRPLRGYNVQLMLSMLQRMVSNGFLLNFVTQTSIAHLTKDKFETVPLCRPPTRAEQSAIAETLSDMDAEMIGLQAKLEKARQVKQGMMQKLLTGKIRLI